MESNTGQSGATYQVGKFLLYTNGVFRMVFVVIDLKTIDKFVISIRNMIVGEHHLFEQRRLTAWLGP